MTLFLVINFYLPVSYFADAVDPSLPLLPSDAAALSALQSSAWGTQLQWQGSPQCLWQGVVCSTTKTPDGNFSVVTSLFLRSLNLPGSPPAALSGLSSLSSLDLRDNQLTGGLSALLPLGSLSYLDVSSNSLAGCLDPLPASLSFLDVSYNTLTCLPPAFVSSMPNLFALILSNNQLAFSLPLLFSSNETQSSTSSVQHFSADSNQISGSLDLLSQQMPQLIHLQLSNNLLTGAIPSALFSLPVISYLDLHRNKLSGVLPYTAPTANFLHLDLANNQLTGSVPSWVCDVDLGNNDFSISNNPFYCPLPSCCDFSTCISPPSNSSSSSPLPSKPLSLIHI